MPTISIRGNEMPASPIRKLAPLADAAKQRGVHVFHLNIGQPDLPTPQVAIDAIRNIDRKVLEYSPSAGYRSYREKLVGYYAKFNINLTADDIIITSGGSEAVLFSFLSCLNPGDEIIVPEPAYANYMAFAISAGAKIRTIATTIEEGFSLPKVEKFEELINERTKAILICNPNNPTGYRSRADGLGGRPGGVQADLCHLSGGTHHVQRLAQNGDMVGGGLDFCGRFLDFAPERFQGASERFGRAGGLLGDGSVGTGRLIGRLLRRRFLSGGLLGGFQSIGIFFCGLGCFLLSNYSLIQGLLSFIRCSSVFPKGRLQMLIALT